ncbi:hypothetical protein [Bosea sp. BIWAKO-01]|uniref:hypothetical protein n=1 Tax=Bosea sp. BIWAKO-01 TaxID=506668 RepID=UPI000852F373|nr:hypothetical protein [Bosea sp. BIWAKO-01]GAU80246.1 hypothetical protein BIWAKO_00132 [Bosea sp. BIWAKO-01]
MRPLIIFAAAMALGIALTILLALAVSFSVGAAYVVAVKGLPLFSTSGSIIPPWFQGGDGFAASTVGFVIGAALGMLTWRPIWRASLAGW